MKKIFAMVAIAMMCIGTASAQNDFKGIVKYSVASSGEVPMDIPAEVSTFELKVMGQKVYADQIAASLLGGGMSQCMIIDGNKVTNAMDFSQFLAYIASAGESLATYTGDGKMLVSDEATQQEIDSLTIPVTEGFYLEYVDGQTEKIAGREAKLVRMHTFGEEGEENIIEIWYDETMGPANNFILYGVKGMPLRLTQNMGEGKALTITATEVVKGKVKEVDFLLPSGFKAVTEEELKTFFTELQEVMQYLQE